MPAKRALVIGGSIAGLVAVGALARHFERVTLVERDTYPDTPAPRKGTPQARHVHVLLKQGEAAIERLFPGLFAELVSRGGQRVDTAGDARWFYFGGWKARFESGIEMVSQSRALLEWTLRRRVLALGNSEIVAGDVQGLDAPTRERVRGVRVHRPDGGAETIAADLVVDASGRGSRMPHWLEQLGCRAPPESEVKVDVGYASRFYARTDAPRDWTALLCHPRHPDTRCGVLLPIEDGRWMLTLVGWFGDHPPAAEAPFLAWAKSLAVADLYEAVKDAEPVSAVALHRFPSNRRRHFERVPALPDGLAVLGDAACSFNPVYAQGMAAGALGAAALDSLLEREGGSARPGFSRRFQARLARVTDSPWLLATGEDFRSPKAEGPRPAFMPLLAWYTARVHELTWRDPFAAQRFLEVMHLVRRPAALFHPRIALRALTTL
ncbi:MAG TPA: FAD-dependent monooxygenase [Myxococcota bacterium]|nr:FAD-dependent monooxygenase [Myxococcota bacterium]